MLVHFTLRILVPTFVQSLVIPKSDLNERTSCCATKHYTAKCNNSDSDVVYTEDMVLLNRAVIWCPNAKVGTTSIFKDITDILKFSSELRCSLQHRCNFPGLVENAEFSPLEELCNVPSVTFIRNPWDRMISTYTDKIASGEINPWESDEASWDWVPKNTPTFAQFVRFVHSQTTKDMNAHWKPYAARCLTGTDDNYKPFQYTHVWKIEWEFEENVNRMLTMAGFDVSKVDQSRRMQNQKTNHSLQQRVQFYDEAADEKSSTAELVHIVGEIYRKDVELGNYRYEQYA